MRSSTLVLAVACGACLDTNDENPGDANGGASSNAPHDPASGLSWPVSYNGQPSSLRRLTRDELVVTMRVLTGDAPTRADLPPTPRPNSGPVLTGGISYVATELPKLELTLDAFATKVAPQMLAQSGCQATAQAQRDCLQKWATGFAQQALRRPARAEEGAIYTKLLAGADGTSAADTSAIEAVLGAIFFSPSFLYRTEVGAPDASRAGVRVLATNEVATRLSYLATLAPPDSALLDAASTGALQDGPRRSSELSRLLHTDLGKHALSVLVLEWLGANEPFARTKSAKYQAGLPSDFEESIRASAEASIADALLTSRGGSGPTVASLLGTRSYLGDPAVASITPAETVREGLLMHPQVLVAHTKDDGSSPFRLGRFLREDVLCEAVAPPPASATTMALADLPSGATLRENYQHKISAGPSCQACHAQFAPLGYAFLPFDPVGRWATQDPSGRPWDLSGSIVAASGRLTFESTRDLVEKLGASPQVHGCFAQAALSWSLGRALVQEDESLVRAVDAVLRETDGDVIAVLQSIVAAPEFTTAIAAR
jgi:hypothetical protein